MTRRCECCGQELRDRLGVRLTAVQRDIFDLVERSGKAGISSEAIFERILAPRGASRVTLKVHVYDINDMLSSTDFEISSVRGRGGEPYRLKRVRSSA